MMNAEILNQRRVSTSPSPSSGYFGTISQICASSVAPTLLLISRCWGTKSKSGRGGRDMRALVDVSPQLKTSEWYLAAQVACDAV